MTPPRDTSRPAKILYVRLPGPLHERLSERAKKDGVGLSETVRTLLRDALKRAA